MKKILLAAILSLFAQAAFAFTIATGPNDGSYFQIAQDIKNVVAKDGVELQVTATKGSLENIELLGNGKTDLAIVQLDALRFVSDVLKQYKGLDLFDKIKIVLNLYPEEIHVLSNKNDIQSFYHLEGKRVSVGTQGGGSAVSAAVLFSVYDINATVSFLCFNFFMAHSILNFQIFIKDFSYFIWLEMGHHGESVLRKSIQELHRIWIRLNRHALVWIARFCTGISVHVSWNWSGCLRQCCRCSL